MGVSEPVSDVHANPHSLDEQLQRLFSQRDDWDGVVGQLARHVEDALDRPSPL